MPADEVQPKDVDLGVSLDFRLSLRRTLGLRALGTRYLAGLRHWVEVVPRHVEPGIGLKEQIFICLVINLWF